MSRYRFILSLATFLGAGAFADEQLTIAVASNFASTARELVAEYTNETGVHARLSTGSTGKLYAQIVNGAPYDVFLAADALRPALLERHGFAVTGSRVTYALGSLVLWSSDNSMTPQLCRAALSERHFRHLAIANPDTAPYGLAAKQFLISAGLWDSLSGRFVFGENISQTLQFVATGNADLGLVAASQLGADLQRISTCHWKVPTSQHGEIEQQAVVIADTDNLGAAIRFMKFLHGPEATNILRRHRYGIPD